MLRGWGSGGPPPEKIGFKWCKIVQFWTPETRNCSLNMPGMLNWFFVMIRTIRKWKEYMTIASSLTLEVIGIFQILTLCFNTGERSEPEKFDYKKIIKTNFGPPLLPIKPPHWTPPLTNHRGCVQTTPLLPMLEREACAHFYRDRNMWRNAARDRVLLNHFNNYGVT